MKAAIRVILAGLTLLGATAAAPAQNWPDRPIKFIS